MNPNRTRVAERAFCVTSGSANWVTVVFERTGKKKRQKKKFPSKGLKFEDRQFWKRERRREFEVSLPAAKPKNLMRADFILFSLITTSTLSTADGELTPKHHSFSLSLEVFGLSSVESVSIALD